MNKYPFWWDTTLTIYNKYEDKQTHVIKWFKTTIQGCFWKYTGDKVSINQVILETNNIIARIPKNDKFLERYKWLQIPNDKMGQYFTLGSGDIIICGEVDDEINEYVSGSRSTDIISKYKDLQGCMIVDKYTNNAGVKRCDPHYYVKGI